MLAVIFENNQHFREVSRSMLEKHGFTVVLSTARLDDLKYFLEKFARPPDLILSSQHSEQLGDFDLGTYLTAQTKFSRTVLLCISESDLQFDRNTSRIDQKLKLPFSAERLRRALSDAFKRRARESSALVFYGSPGLSAELRDMVLAHVQFPWKKIYRFESARELRLFLREKREPLGAILIEANDELASALSEIRAYQRSRLGAGMQIAFTKPDAKRSSVFRTLSPLIFSNGQSLEQMIEILSECTQGRWELKNHLQEIKHLGQRSKPARAQLKMVLKKFTHSSEALELDGIWSKSSASLIKALELKPHSASTYLALLNLCPADQRQFWQEQSALYCPTHPQLIELRK